MENRVLKEKNENSLVGIGTVEKKVIPIVTIQDEKDQVSNICSDEILLSKENYSNVELSHPVETLNKTNSQSSLPDIVNGTQTKSITLNQLTSTEQSYKIIPSGGSSSISSDDELFVECKPFPLTDNNMLLIKKNLSHLNQNKNIQSENHKESDTISEHNSSWKNVLSSLSSQNIESLENSKIDLDVSPQDLYVCSDIAFNKNIELDQNININDTNIFQTTDNYLHEFVDQKTITNIIDEENYKERANYRLNLTNENIAKDADNAIDNILTEQIRNLQISPNSLNLTVETKNMRSSDIDFNKTVDMFELADNIKNITINNNTFSNETINEKNLTTDVEILELPEIRPNTIEPAEQPILENIVEKTIPSLDDLKYVKQNITENSHTAVTNTQLEQPPQLNFNSNLEDNNFNVTMEDTIQLITSNIAQENISNIQAEKSSTETNISDLTDSKYNENLFKTSIAENNKDMSPTAEEVPLNQTTVEEINQNTNLNKTHEVLNEDISEHDNTSHSGDDNVNLQETNMKYVNDQKQTDNLNCTIDIIEQINDDAIAKTSIKSPNILEQFPEATVATQPDKIESISLLTKSKNNNELDDIICSIKSEPNSPNTNDTDNSNKEKLNMTFAVSTEALNSTINDPLAKSTNLPIVSSPILSNPLQENIELQKYEEIRNDDIKEEDFQSNALILNQWDFDFLLTKGNNNNNIPVNRSSLLLKFDPLLGKPQIIQPQQLLDNQGSKLSCPTVEEEEYFDIVTSLNLSKQKNLLGFVPENSTNVGVIEPLDVNSNKMSIDAVRDMKNENNLISPENDINSSDVKFDLKMEDLEKKIQNEVLKRTEEIGKKIKEIEQREEALLRRITEKDKTTAKMGSVIEAYEKAIAEMITEKEEITNNYERQIAEIKSERDLNYQHLASLESTFADLHVKYERSKQITAKLKVNEEESSVARKQFLENLRLQEQRYEKMKNHAMQQLDIANNKLEFLTKNHASETTKLKALLKKEEISKGSIAEQLQQKTRENEELVKICDELINGQGS